MGRTVRTALIQAHANLPKDEALAKHVEMVNDAARQGAQLPVGGERLAQFSARRGRSRSGEASAARSATG